MLRNSFEIFVIFVYKEFVVLFLLSFNNGCGHTNCLCFSGPRVNLFLTSGGAFGGYVLYFCYIKGVVDRVNFQVTVKGKLFSLLMSCYWLCLTGQTKKTVWFVLVDNLL